ncbi:hypothetical protein AK830_g9197 [Neonectria ditissima]|uniref:Uncharacterized protein n=1 Tax=Neonectria ditissima TaxID=78410 RepID=A0A0P7AIR9_9HYPO|nr:hypothetical protein AK830_g9197 [Neonectria ditissima]
MLHGAQSPSSVSPAASAVAVAADAAENGYDQTARSCRRKRKAGMPENERLSKRLSLLNLEQGGNKLYVPVETPSSSITNPNTSASSSSRSAPILDDTMQLDNSKHKVYIYNIDDELSSDSESDDCKLVFLPDIEKHLRATRIPPSILAKKDADSEGMEVVLYSDPKSITVPEDKDSVRKAIVESRRRMREQQRLERENKVTEATTNTTPVDNMSMAQTDHDPDAMDMD